eukprot:2734800-Amphidinium_carterae.1
MVEQVGVLGTTGTVQYYGEVKFATGEWVGVQLDEPRGRIALHMTARNARTRYRYPRKPGKRRAKCKKLINK